MDAVASIINIIQLTGTLVDYLRAAKEAPSDRRKLLLEANSLFALLTSLKDFIEIEDKDDFPDWKRAVRELDAPNGPFAQYYHGLVSLLKKLRPTSGVRKVAQTIMWKLEKEDVMEVLSRIERLKSLVTIALEMDHTRLSEAILSTSHSIKLDTLRLIKSADDASFRSLLDQICPDDYASVFQSNITEHTSGIGQNFIASSEFETWSGSDAACRTLLCLGDAGVGKTVMATKAVQELHRRSSSLREAVIFLYCDCTRRRSRLYRRDSSPEARSKGVQTPGHFISSLLRQLVEIHGAPVSSLEDLIARHDRRKTKPKAQELGQVFTEVAQNFDRIFVVVDAMDECDSLEMETFASHLLSICAAPVLRLLVTSRKHPQIEQIFEDSVRLEMRAYDDDTLQYLQSRARREFPPRVLRDPQALDRILSALLLSANGIPLIARLHMNALRGLRTPGAMLAAIARLKSDSEVYDETYQAAMERITKQPGELPAMAMKVLRWVVCAKRYLFTRELQCVLAMHEDSDGIDEDFMPDMDDVFLACEGLICTVTIPGTDFRRLELVHTTARQYFDTKLAQWAPDVSLDLTRTCLNVLTFEDLRPLPESLVVYAWGYWGQHAKDVEDLNEEEQFRDLVSIIRKFLAKDDARSPLSRTITIHEKLVNPIDALEDEVTGYHLAAKFGLTRLFEALWEPSDHLDNMIGAHGQGVTPLLQGIISESPETVKAMLKLRCVDPNARTHRMNPLHAAILFELTEMVEILLEHSAADPRGVDPLGRPLVLLAAIHGQKRAVELMLSANAMNAEVRAEFGPLLLDLASMNAAEQAKRITMFESAPAERRQAFPLDRPSSGPVSFTENLRAHLRTASMEGLGSRVSQLTL